jgi:ubiquinone/menaquinone biosynthesis C-methylase UbiE
MNENAIRDKRDQTQAHYDKYPFRFDQRAIVDEKMENRLMGAAIAELPDAGATIVDVGCGACRVADMVSRAGKGHAFSVDISLETLRSAKAHNRSPVVNADNMKLPVRSDAADLVISNGVIMITPDARTSFDELARITKPGGELVVSVYDRRSWYYPVYMIGSPIVRRLRDWIGDTGLKLTIFPFFHVATLLLMAVALRKPMSIPIEISWNLFHDQFTTPNCTFHTFEEISAWAEAAGLICAQKRREAANQLISFRLSKPRS